MKYLYIDGSLDGQVVNIPGPIAAGNVGFDTGETYSVRRIELETGQVLPLLVPLDRTTNQALIQVLSDYAQQDCTLCIHQK